MVDRFDRNENLEVAWNVNIHTIPGEGGRLISYCRGIVVCDFAGVPECDGVTLARNPLTIHELMFFNLEFILL